MTFIKEIKKVQQIGFRVHTPNLLQDIIANQVGHNAGVLKVPLNQFQKLLALLAERATELNDPELNIICLSLGLYEVEPLKIPMKIEEQILLLKKGKQCQILKSPQFCRYLKR